MKKNTFIFSAVNFVGLILFSSIILGICRGAKMEQRDFYDFGDFMIFIFVALPIFMICFLLDFYWLVKAVRAVFRRDYHDAGILAVVTTVWAVSCLIVWHLTMLP